MSANVADGALDGEVLPPKPKPLTLAERNALGSAARDAHAAVERAGKDVVEHARATGAILTKAKDGIPHGEFQRWLDRDAGIRPRTAQAYMRLARELPKLPEAEARRVARLSLRDAIAELSRTSSKAVELPPPALDRALAEARRDPLKKALAGAANNERDPPTAPATTPRVEASSAESELPKQPMHGGLVRTVLAQAEAYKRRHPRYQRRRPARGAGRGRPPDPSRRRGARSAAVSGGNFGRHAPGLEAAGFDVVPITLPDPGDRAAGKKPAVADWQVPRPAAGRLPRYARCGLGILAARTPAVDIDVRLSELADELHRGAAAVLGDTPVRYGAAPKRLLPYRTLTPFPKLSTSGYALPGDGPGDKPHRLEVLGDGQQFVTFGVHPELDRPYAWIDGSLLDLEWQDLPEIDAAAAARFVPMAERRFLAFGGKLVERSGTRRPRAAGWRAGPAPRPVRSLGEARQVLAALERLPNADLPYDDWLAVAYALKAALGGEAGWPLFKAWSRQAEAKHDDATAKHRWRTIRPSKAGWRYLLRLADAADGRG